MAGYAVLICGSVAALLVYRAVPDHDPNDPLVAGIHATKADEYRLELYGGKSNVLGTEIQEWFFSLWHGRRLASTLAVITFIVAVVCFFLAYALPDFPPAHAEPEAEAKRLKKIRR